MADIQGTCQDRFAAVRDALAASLDDQDVGASAAVYVDGEPVVDIWGGYVDAARTMGWQRDTITCAWSTTKTMTALCALILADRGELDLAAPVARYWPEFAAAGKERVQVRHVLSHTAGLPDWDPPITTAVLYDWADATARLAAQPARWAPGTVAGYHSITQGFLAGEVVRRITGSTLGEFFAAEVAGPLDADFHIGLAAEHDHRVAPVIAPPPPAKAKADDKPPREGSTPLRPEEANTEAWRRAGLPAAGGFGNAHSVAAVQSVLACGGAARGVRLLSAAGCERAREEQFHGEDRVLRRTMRYGMGYGLMGGSCFWGGWGGSMIMIDFETRMTVSYVMNQMLDQGTMGDDRALSIVMAAYEGVS
ncbi:MAG TPA: serine hydrolase domain-containing protein [Streptosporangiaceae bacterium]|nr:serine hydrolase domain-containing protein [Streptosporangiaceae bacterium]